MRQEEKAPFEGEKILDIPKDPKPKLIEDVPVLPDLPVSLEGKRESENTSPAQTPSKPKEKRELFSTKWKLTRIKEEWEVREFRPPSPPTVPTASLSDLMLGPSVTEAYLAKNKGKQLQSENGKPVANVWYWNAVEPESAHLGRIPGESIGMVSYINPDFEAFVNELASSDPEEDLKRVKADIDDAYQNHRVVDNLCVSCENQGLKQCNLCKLARYCSKECQTADWPMHKKVCKGFAVETADNARPSPKHRRILFFPAYDPKPKLLWAVPELVGERNVVRVEHPDIEKFWNAVRESENDLLDKWIQIARINLHPPFKSRRIGTTLLVQYYGIKFPRPKSFVHVNRSINAISEPGYLRPFFGPVLVFSDEGKSDPRDQEIRDITPREVHTAVRFFETLDCPCLKDPKQWPSEVIGGIKVSDLRLGLNVAMGIQQPYEPVYVPLQPIKQIDSPIALAFLLGLRWYLRDCNYLSREYGANMWSDLKLFYLGITAVVDQQFYANVKKTDHGRQVQGATGDSTFVNPVRPFGRPSFIPGRFIGSMIVLHGSGKPLDIAHLLCFDNYMQDVFSRAETPSKEGFEGFWEKWRVGANGNLLQLSSPYELEKDEIKDRLGWFNPKLVMETIGQHKEELLAVVKKEAKAMMGKQTSSRGGQEKHNLREEWERKVAEEGLRD